jgi:Protein of unknown function (DUF3182)
MVRNEIPRQNSSRHKTKTGALLTADAKAIAGLKQYDLEEQYDVSKNYAGPIYFVPDDTLLLDEAQRLGIHGPSDLYGGVVPHLFVKTKSITHPLVDEGAERPRGWSFQFAEQVRNIVLPGYTVFGHRDLRIAATQRVCSHGVQSAQSDRPKLGGGQTPITTVEEVEALREKMPAEEIATYGLVLEENLHQVTTLSIGHITFDNICFTYHGHTSNWPEGASAHKPERLGWMPERGGLRKPLPAG